MGENKISVGKFKNNWVLSRNEQIPNRKNRNLCKKNRKLIGFVARQMGFSVGKKRKKLASIVASKKRLGRDPDGLGPKQKEEEHMRAEKKGGGVGPS